MPTVSSKQAVFMRAAAHSAKCAKKVGIKQSVAREFVEADKQKAGKVKIHGKRKSK